jgi:hypothetical protein
MRGMNAPPRMGIPLRPDAEALAEMAMTNLVRACITTVATKLDPNLDGRAYVRQRWGNEANSVNTVLKAASTPAMTSTTGWAKELATVTSAFLGNLTPFSAGADLLRRTLGLSFNGVGSINLPTVSVPLADFVAEGGPIPVVNGVSSIQAVLSPYKFAVITVLSRETIESGNSEALVRDALLQSTGPSLDRRLFDANAGVANLRPPGLLHNITPLTPASGTGQGKDDAMKDDLQALLAAVAPVAGNGPIVLIAAPAQAVTIGLRTLQTFSYAVLTSSQLAAGTVIAVACSAVVSAADAGPAIDTTRAASVQMNDSPSSDLMTGGAVRAMFQTDCLGLRLRWPITWAVRDPRGIAFMQNVLW